MSSGAPIRAAGLTWVITVVLLMTTVSGSLMQVPLTVADGVTPIMTWGGFF